MAEEAKKPMLPWVGPILRLSDRLGEMRRSRAVVGWALFPFDILLHVAMFVVLPIAWFLRHPVPDATERGTEALARSIEASVQARRAIPLDAPPDDLVRFARHESPDVRCVALADLAERRGYAGMEPFLIAMRDPALGVRLTAIEKLAQMEDLRVMPSLADYLDRPPDERSGAEAHKALAYLVERGGELSDQPELLRRLGVDTYDEIVRPMLEESLDFEAQAELESAARRLAYRPSPRALRKALKSRDREKRRAAAFLLCRAIRWRVKYHELVHRFAR